MLRVTFSRPNLADPAWATRWQTLAHAWQASPFLSWPWIGCLAAERYTDPIAAEIHDGTTITGLALFNRRRTPWATTLHLHETGNPAQDAIFIEHNAPLAPPGQAPQALAAILQATRRNTRVVLSGIDDTLLAAAQATGLVAPIQTRQAPYATLGGTSALSKNTRAQLNRSNRSYAATAPIQVHRPETIAEAQTWLQNLTTLHAATWSARNIQSNFTTPAVQRFHQELLHCVLPGNTIDLLHIAAGPRTIGYLLNFKAHGQIAAYQSGFDYAQATPHEKPGLTSHHAAIAQATAAGATEYDFLAGDARYKRSLATGARALHWCTWQRPNTPAGLIARARQTFAR